MYFRIAVIASMLLAVGSSAAAKTTLVVQPGWGNTIREGRWNPVVLTLADPDAPDAIVEVSSYHDRLYGMKIRQYVGTLSTSPKQFELLVPIEGFSPYGSDPVWVTVRNAKTGKVLAKTEPDDSMEYRSKSPWEVVQAGGHMIGVSGQNSRLADITSFIPGAHFSIDHLPVPLLPITATGYEMLDVLVLNAPDFNELMPEQQQAIADWVKAGGNLILWPGDSPPQTGPLADLLPCTIGKLGITELSEDTLKRLTLQKRFGRLASRELTPVNGGEPVDLFDDTVGPKLSIQGGPGKTVGYRRTAGLGSVFVSPINLSDLHFDDKKVLWALWTRVLEPMFELPPTALSDETINQNNYGRGASNDDNLKSQVADMLGTVPGAGRFGFSYVAIVLIGMMIIVGPVDWFVLKKLKKQAWTWVTTSGWIALVTLGAIYIGHAVKSGDLHLRTYSVIDQVDGATVARQEFVGIYSPSTTNYNLSFQALREDGSSAGKSQPAGGWWQPFAPGMGMYYGYGGNERSTQVDFHQTYRDNLPTEMQINVWSLRFLEGQATEPGAARIEAAFHLEIRNGAPWAVGKVTNLSKVSGLRGLRLMNGVEQTIFHPADSPKDDIVVAPGASVDLEGAMTSLPVVPNPNDPNTMYGYRDYSETHVDANVLWTAAAALGDNRSARIQRLIRSGTHACLLAGVENPTAPVKLDVGPAIEQHWQIIRAIVPLQQK